MHVSPGLRKFASKHKPFMWLTTSEIYSRGNKISHVCLGFSVCLPVLILLGTPNMLPLRPCFYCSFMDCVVTCIGTQRVHQLMLGNLHSMIIQDYLLVIRLNLIKHLCSKCSSIICFPCKTIKTISLPFFSRKRGTYYSHGKPLVQSQDWQY